MPLANKNLVDAGKIDEKEWIRVENFATGRRPKEAFKIYVEKKK